MPVSHTQYLFTTLKALLLMPLLAVGELGALVADFVGAGVGLEEGRHICQGGVGNVGESFSREEGLVRSHDDVRHRDQAGEGVVGDDVPGVIVEEDVRFLFVHIEAGRADLALFDALEKGLGINQSATGGVDDYNAFLHALNRLRVDHVAVLVRQRAVQGNDIAPCKKLVEFNVLDARVGSGEFVIGDDVHAETAADVQEDSPDLAGTDDSDGLAVQVKSGQPVQAEIEVARTDVSLVNPADGGQKKRHRMLRHRIRRVGRHANHVNSSVSMLDVDIVVAGAAKRDEPHAHLINAVDHIRVDVIIDENTHRVAAFRELAGVFRQPRLIIRNLKLPRSLRRVEGVSVIIFCIEKCDAKLFICHGIFLSSSK